MRLWLAIKSFFQVLFDAKFAGRVEQLKLEAPAKPAPQPAEPTPPAKPSKPARSDAVTLLATLQREARFVDIVSESLDGYSDAQIGAAARDVLRDCGKVLERLFAIEALSPKAEGEQLEVPDKYDAAEYRLTGRVANDGCVSKALVGTVVHAGWTATKCDLPQWSGSDHAALVVAPVEVQIG